MAEENDCPENFSPRGCIEDLFAADCRISTDAVSAKHPRTHRRIETKDERVYSQLGHLTSAFSLPRHVQERIAHEYRRAYDDALVAGYGNSRSSVIAALTYAMCREYGVPRTLGEVANASGLSRRNVGKTYRYLSRVLRLKVPKAQPEDYMQNFASAIGLDEKVKEKAMTILSDVRKLKIPYERASGAAAAAIYMASLLRSEYVRIGDIERATTVSSVTILKYLDAFSEKLGTKKEMKKRVGDYRTWRKEEIVRELRAGRSRSRG